MFQPFLTHLGSSSFELWYNANAGVYVCVYVFVCISSHTIMMHLFTNWTESLFFSFDKRGLKLQLRSTKQLQIVWKSVLLCFWSHVKCEKSILSFSLGCFGTTRKTKPFQISFFCAHGHGIKSLWRIVLESCIAWYIDELHFVSII